MGVRYPSIVGREEEETMATSLGGRDEPLPMDNEHDYDGRPGRGEIRCVNCGACSGYDGNHFYHLPLCDSCIKMRPC